jgi:hypothetical protein
MRHARDGSVLDVGQKTRTIPPAIRGALEARDRHCQFPGCTARRCDGHHIRHWADGGPTRLDNLTLLCRRHHRAVHEGAFTIAQRDEGTPMFYRPDGTCVEIAPAVPRGHQDVEPRGPTAGRLIASSVATGPCTAMARGDRAPLDVAWAIDILRDSAFTNPAARDCRDREHVGNFALHCPRRSQRPRSGRQRQEGAGRVRRGRRRTLNQNSNLNRT